MNELPPVIKPPMIPPPVPRYPIAKPPQTYIDRCKVLCAVAATFVFLVVLGGILGLVIGEKIEYDALVFCCCYVVLGYSAAALLHQRRPLAYSAAMVCIIILLVVIPIGTVFGILGIIWLNKGKALLKG